MESLVEATGTVTCLFRGFLNSLEIPLNPPLEKGDFMESLVEATGTVACLFRSFFNSLEIPLNPPLEKGDFMESLVVSTTTRSAGTVTRPTEDRFE